jgi:hypothetical protein
MKKFDVYVIAVWLSSSILISWVGMDILSSWKLSLMKQSFGFENLAFYAFLAILTFIFLSLAGNHLIRKGYQSQKKQDKDTNHVDINRGIFSLIFSTIALISFSFMFGFWIESKLVFFTGFLLSIAYLIYISHYYSRDYNEISNRLNSISRILALLLLIIIFILWFSR